MIMKPMMNEKIESESNQNELYPRPRKIREERDYSSPNKDRCQAKALPEIFFTSLNSTLSNFDHKTNVYTFFSSPLRYSLSKTNHDSLVAK